MRRPVSMRDLSMLAASVDEHARLSQYQYTCMLVSRLSQYQYTCMLVSRCTRDKNVFVSLAGCVGLVFFFGFLLS